MTYILFKNNHKILVTTNKNEIEEIFRQELVMTLHRGNVKREVKQSMRKLFKNTLPKYKIYKIE